jgi:hypothetical protein
MGPSPAGSRWRSAEWRLSPTRVPCEPPSTGYEAVAYYAKSLGT